MITSLENLEALELKGILIRLDGSVNAFAIVSHLNDEMGVLNYEKAFSNVKGLYQYLDNQNHLTFTVCWDTPLLWKCRINSVWLYATRRA